MVELIVHYAETSNRTKMLLVHCFIKESGADDSFFDFLKDVGESGKQTGRLFGVEVKAFNGSPVV